MRFSTEGAADRDRRENVARPSGQQNGGKRQRRVRRVGWAVGLLAVAAVSWCFFLAHDIWTYAPTVDERSADAAIVLGARVIGEVPSPVFLERIHHAVGLYDRGLVSAIVFTGGASSRDDAEAIVGRDAALAEGLPLSDLLWEETSRSTLENLVEAGRIARSHGLTTFVIVSDPLHMCRAMTIAEDLGLDARPSPTPTTRIRSLGSRLLFLARETLAYGSYLILRALGLR